MTTEMIERDAEALSEITDPPLAPMLDTRYCQCFRFRPVVLHLRQARLR